MLRKLIDTYAYKNEYTVLRLDYFNYALLDDSLGRASYHKTLLGVLLKMIINNKKAF